MDERKQRLIDIDKKYVWHPFTQMQDWLESDPLIIERGEGNWLFDIDGKRYLDGVSSLWCNIHGHCVPEIDAAIREQLDLIAHSTLLGLAGVPSIELAEMLVQFAPEGLTKVFYSDSGATAMEIALKMAYQYWQQNGQTQRTTYLTLSNAYHGDTIGSVSLGGIDTFFKKYRPLLFECKRIESPYCYRCPLGKEHPGCGMACLDEAERILEKSAGEIAAFVIEPLMQGAAGMITQPPGYLKRVREMCDRYDVLLICDEVAIGFGRSGKMFACEKEGVRPDIMAIAKGISAGYLPLAATLTSQRVFDGFLGDISELKTFFHGHTYTGNALGCAAAIANLKIFQREGFFEDLNRRIEIFAQLLEKKIRPVKWVGDIRRQGFMTGIELVKDRSTREEWPYEERIGHHICMKAREDGVILRPLGSVLVLMPPLSIKDEEIELLVDVAARSIEEICNERC